MTTNKTGSKLPQPEILFVTYKYPPTTGGMQKQSFELIQNSRQYAKVHTIIYSNRYPVLFFLLAALPRTYIKLVRNRSINVVHANDALLGMMLYPITLIKSVRLCATVHGLDIVTNIWIYQLAIRKVLSRLNLLISVSEGTKNECLLRGVNENRVVVIPNSVDLAVSPKQNISMLISTDKRILLSVGRAVPRKGFHWFARHVLPELQNCMYVVVGPKVSNPKTISFLRKYLPKSVFRLLCSLFLIYEDALELDSLSKDVLFKDKLLILETVSDAQLESLYQHADVFIMPNQKVKGDFEGFGLVTLEAVIRGLPCIASNIDGIPSAIKDGHNGYLVSPTSTTDWKEKISLCLDNPEIGSVFKSNILSDQYSWDEMTKRYLSAFKQLLS